MRARAGSRAGVTLARAARLVTHGPADLLDQVGLDDFHGTHLLADAVVAVVAVRRPLGAASDTVVAAAARQRGCLGGGGEQGQDLVLGPWGDFGRCRHPAGEVGFEGELVDVAVVAGLAGDFVPGVGEMSLAL